MAEKGEYENIPKNEQNTDPLSIAQPPKGFGTRHTQTLILFISLTVAYTMRAQLSVSMVAMIDTNIREDRNTPINHTANTVNLNGVANTTTEISEKNACKSWNVYRTYNWNKSTQEMILFSFFVGYTTMMMPMGFLSQKYGGKRPILVALAVNSIISILTPWLLIFGGWVALCACRVLQGMAQAAFYPSIHNILGKWAPLSERGRLTTYVYTGCEFGIIVTFQISGVFAGSPMFGWPATFWLCGSLGVVSFVLLSWLGAATPQDHPHISTEELAYIMADGSVDTSSKNGLYSSLPYIAMYLMAMLFGVLSDYLANKKIMSLVNIRRTANTMALAVAGLLLLLFSYINNTAIAVILLIMSLGLHSGIHVGFHINQIDLAPNFAGPIMALGNMIANLTSLLVPVIVSNIVTEYVKNQSRWQLVFITIVSFQIITNTIFVIFVKATVQPWNFYGEDKNAYEKVKVSNENNAK